MRPSVSGTLYIGVGGILYFAAPAIVGDVLAIPVRAVGFVLVTVGGSFLLVVAIYQVFRVLPDAVEQTVFCDWLNIHTGPVETHGDYTYIDCQRCGELRQPALRYVDDTDPPD